VAIWAVWIYLQAARLALRKQILAVAVARERSLRYLVSQTPVTVRYTTKRWNLFARAHA